MAINKFLIVALVFMSIAAYSRETASPSACQAAAVQPAVANAKAAVDRTPADLPANFGLADAWSDAGCFNDALQVLQRAAAAHPGNKELETRLRVARSLVGEEHFFDNLDRADAEAKLKRDTFRCTTLADLEACNEAVRLSPDNAQLLIAQSDALVRAKRPDAMNRYRSAVPEQRDVPPKIGAAGGQQNSAPQPSATSVGASAGKSPALRVASSGAAEAPARRYTNAAPETRSH